MCLTGINIYSFVYCVIYFYFCSYFRQFRLYKYIFTIRRNVILKQQLPNEVEYTMPIPPLSSGFQVLDVDSMGTDETIPTETVDAKMETPSAKSRAKSKDTGGSNKKK